MHALNFRVLGWGVGGGGEGNATKAILCFEIVAFLSYAFEFSFEKNSSKHNISWKNESRDLIFFDPWLDQTNNITSLDY